MTDAATVTPIEDHPAKFSTAIIEELVDILTTHLEPHSKVLDPFAGTGLIHAIGELAGMSTWGVEIEPEWAALHEHTICGDSRDLAAVFGDDPVLFDAIVTSPAYGNRMADNYDGRDGSRRHTYRIALRRPLTDGNGAALHWGPKYRRLHIDVWREAAAVLRPGGLFVVNVKDFIRKRKPVHVADWHRRVLTRVIGLELLEDRFVQTPGLRDGANADLRMDGEHIYVMRKPR